MSCGNPNDVDCSSVLDQVYEYLHSELDHDRLTQIHAHLKACGPCLQEYGLEEVMRELIHRSCHCTPAPEELRLAIISTITEIRGSGPGV